ncbi:MAG: glycosyltransferase family 2 protein [Bacteroidota bacterium]
MLDISILVPVYDEEESLPELETWIKKVMTQHKFRYEIIFVDDGSRDASWKVIESLVESNDAVKGIKFRRNYGKSAALNTGFGAAQGDVVITMDADLQDSPDEVPELHRMIMEDGYDFVSGWKKKRHDPLSKTIPSKFFNGITRYVSGIKLNDFNCGLKAYKNAVVHSIEVYGEMHRYIPVIAKWAGFNNVGEKVVQHQERKYGVGKFNGWYRGVKGLLDLSSIMFVGKFGKRPMHFFGPIGVLMFLVGFFSAFYIGAVKLYRLGNGIPTGLVVENPWFFIALTSMVLGTLLFMGGFLAELMSRTASDRNNYLIEKRIGNGDAINSIGG